MTDQLWADVSEYQVAANDTYPYHFIAFRSNDGSYRDTHFLANLAWAKRAYANGKIAGFMVYFVWEPDWKTTVAVFKRMVGTPHPGMAVMVDAESWSGRITGDRSAGLNAAREDIIAWLGKSMTVGQRAKKLHRKRVVGYGNAGDLAALWPRRGDTKIVLANYSSNPAYPGKFAHQFSSKFTVAPFGPCDINSADGMTLAQLCAALGLPAPVALAPKPTPAPVPVPTPAPVVLPPVLPPVTPDMATDLDARFSALRNYIVATYKKG